MSGQFLTDTRQRKARALHPIVELKTGRSAITTIPPNFLQEFKFISETERSFEVEIVLIDPTFKDVERLLLTSDSSGDGLQFRFGYPGDIAATSFRQAKMTNYLPSLDNGGMRITINAVSRIAEAAYKVYGLTFKGRVSEVVAQVVEVMRDLVPSISAIIETTDDEERNTDRLWSTNGMSLFQFLETVLLREANSSDSTEAYQTAMAGNVLHFHTPSFSELPQNQRPPREFTYLRGRNDDVISFIPNVNSNALGGMGGSGGIVGRSFDPETGQFRFQFKDSHVEPPVVVNRQDQANTPEKDDADPDLKKARTTAIVILEDRLPASADAAASYFYRTLFRQTFDAKAVLVGGPHLVDLVAFEQIKMTVVLPDGTIHPTSGLYRVQKAEHSIRGAYEITLDLTRGTSMLAGETIR